MNDVKVFENSEFGSVRTVMVNNEPYFVGKDVADILGYVKPRNAIALHVDNEDKRDAPIQGDLGGKQSMTVINESGMYSLILSSKLPTAKKFKHWVTSEVLPTIRKTGGYVADDDKFIQTYLPYADEPTKQLFKVFTSTINQLNHKIDNDKPLVDFAMQVSDTEDLVDMAQFSKLCAKQGIHMGRNKMFSWFRENGYLRWNNEPYQQYITAGYFKIKEFTYNKGTEQKIGIKTYITAKGQIYLFKKMRLAIGA